MKVKDLIKILKKCDPESTVTVWGCFKDRCIDDVVVSKSNIANEVHIGEHSFGCKTITASSK